MPTIGSSATVTIDRTANEVWEYVVDPAKLHSRVKDINSPGNWIGEGGPSVGSRYRVDYDYGRKTNEIIFEVTDSKPGTRFGTDTVEGLYPISVEYTLSEVANGESTELTIFMNARSDSTFTAILFVLTGWFAKSFMKKRLRRELSDLKQAIESV
ncbi:MAG: SRPBCC family protein [Dehalococcoidia bacterium]|nr:SRPBCC family protein [Dehalococcoidia bacterium]